MIRLSTQNRCRERDTTRALRLAIAMAFMVIMPFSGCESDRSPDEQPPVSVTEHRRVLDELRSNGRITEAVEYCQQQLARRPDQSVLRSELAEIFAGCGRPDDAQRELRQLLGEVDLTQRQLICLLKNGRQLYGRSQLRRWQRLSPTDPHVLVGLASHDIQNRNLQSAQQILQQASRDSPFAQQLKLWVDGRLKANLSPADRRALSSFLKSSSTNRPAWRTAGEILLDRGHSDLGVSCFVRALGTSPWDSELLSAIHERIRHRDGARPDDDFAARVEIRLQHARAIAGIAQRLMTGASLTDVRAAVEHLSALERYREAVQWARLALRQSSGVDSDGPSEVIVRLNNRRHPETDALVSALRKRFPLPLHDVIAVIVESTPERSPSDNESALSAMQFRDVAADVGLRFRYENGVKARAAGLKMFQWTGGGVGVIDVDNDTWPDLYLTQGGTPEAGRSDSLFRNIRGREYRDLSDECCLRSSGFGQGVAVGDINHDGFDDIYVGNFGANEFLVSMGDGTFQSVTLTDGRVGQWTTSTAIADLNGDGSPDLYDCNYLEDPRVLTQTCDHDGRQRVCGPRDFRAAADRLLLSNGAGGFAECDELASLTVDSRGMGLIVGDFTASGENQVYVANDETGNHLFSLTNGSIVDSAVQAGLSVDSFGNPMGSMGIACGDAAQTGQACLFVTNYYSEANNFYMSTPAGTFRDEAAAFRLKASGYSTVGFGCQFSDVDGDGDLDLFVANGHLDDFRFLNQPYRMRSQLFENLGGQVFREFVPESEYFADAQIGRAVATLDWNGDGRGDFVVTTIDDHVQLVTNETTLQHRGCQLRLVGVRSCRRPVGARVAGVTESLSDEHPRPQTRWLTAGDGYQCSNSQLLQFAQTDRQPLKLRVTWPAKVQTTFESTDVAGNSTLAVIVEGRAVVYEVSR